MKKITLLILSICSIILVTGCFKRDNMDDIKIITTTYPIHYLIDSIYGYNSEISSIYPNGIEVKTYEISNRKIKEYSKTDMFVYNGLSNEKQIALSFINLNKNIKMIDAAKGRTINYDEEELWLCPSTYLILAQNIKDELIGYVTTTILKQEINEKFDILKVNISKYGVELKNMADNANNKTIIAGNDVFKFLENYGFKVLSIEDNEYFSQSEYMEAKNAITNKKNKYVYILDTDIEDENTKALVKAGAKVIKINAATTLTEKESDEKYDYNNMMNDFIDNLKLEAYN